MRSIWAVAVNTVKQALRLKFAAVFVVLLIILLPTMGLVMTGDGTLKGKLQSFVSYGLSLTSFLLCFLTIAVSTYSVSNDIKEKQIYMVLTKPIRRCQFLIGKVVGVVLLSMILLILFSGVIYVIAVQMPRFSEASAAEKIQVEKEFFTARAGLVPDEEDVRGEVKAAYTKLKDRGQLPEGASRRKVIERLTLQKQIEKRAAAVGQELVWEFDKVRLIDLSQSLFIRFKYDVSVNPTDYQVYGKWTVGDNRPIKYGTRIETPIYEIERKDSVRDFHEIEIPSDAVAADGFLAVGFLNVPLNRTVVIFPPGDGIEVLYKADTFAWNFVRAVILLFFRLIFLACLGVFASTFLSFPVAILLCLAVFFTGTINGFVVESFDYMAESIGWIYSFTFKPIVKLLPQFDKYSPTNFIVTARLLSWAFLGKVAVVMVCIKATILLILALVIFSYKEIAKIVV